MSTERTTSFLSDLAKWYYSISGEKYNVTFYIATLVSNKRVIAVGKNLIRILYLVFFQNFFIIAQILPFTFALYNKAGGNVFFTFSVNCDELRYRVD